ncbi:MAG: hypothetical protein ACYDCC_01585 [Actinomycetota bacterium]
MKRIMICCAAITMMATGARADGSITAPYPHSNVNRYCTSFVDSLGSTCDNNATASKTSGSIVFDITMTSALKGKLPGQGLAQAIGTVGETYVLTQAAPALRITTTYHVGSANASIPTGTTGEESTASVSTWIDQTSPTCPGACGWRPAAENVVIVDRFQNQSVPSVADEDITETSLLQRCDGNLPTGEYSIQSGFFSQVALEEFPLAVPAAGSAHADIDAVVVSIDLAPGPADPSFSCGQG